MKHPPAAILILLSGVILSGCAGYEYDLVRPAALARHIGSKDATNVALAPMAYSFEAVQDHLVIWVRNPTADPIRILGDRSVVVDPGGQSHPLRSQTIAPASFIKLILPPLHTYTYGYGPPVIIWAGGGDYAAFRHGFYEEDGPDYVVAADPGDPIYFAWDGQTDVSLTLSFERSGKIFEQSFVFHRTKVG